MLPEGLVAGLLRGASFALSDGTRTAFAPSCRHLRKWRRQCAAIA